jgi:hypothetical protein
MENKVVIGGTGRAGTTFLMKVLTHLGLNTGFTVDELDNHIHPETLGGLEVMGTKREEEAYFIKNPHYSFQIPRLVNQYEIDFAILCIRDLHYATMSRVNNGSKSGGLWMASDFESQKNHNLKAVYQFIYDCSVYCIPVKIINFQSLILGKDCAVSTIMEITGLSKKDVRETIKQVKDEK